MIKYQRDKQTVCPAGVLWCNMMWFLCLKHAIMPDEPDFAFQRRCFSHAVKYITAKYSVKQNKGRAR